MKRVFEQIQNDHRIFVGSEYKDRSHYKVDDLIQNKKAMKELLTKQKDQLNAPNLAITGLLFGKMYSVLTMGLFETMIRHGVVIDASPENICIELKEKNAMNYIVDEDAVHKIADLPEEEVKESIHTFITQHLQPLFQTVAQVSKCKTTHMRSIVSHNLHQRKCVLVKDQADEWTETVFRWFTTHELFKENKRNPLHFKFRFYQADNGKETYVRRHCCMKYMLHDADKAKCCPTCPLIPDEERDDRIK
ncbi:IucA/IucC family C-terminal-domain containing protein [Halobacillus aidingensis]|uniref:Ferric iron reductase protein FhuF, involved in iron transport n=1 Tax=Halobacillus aidingensis TaxID=240303 RepID=A0A1H0FK00_HALAD|nr:IucA/IucC family C-terminal-domain containing protein [Halobacillus aidingensis]SDN94987.1 Ferric iron reductase protein FhuF, involved in iron transport [Halobacillus aidingensis]